MLFPQSHSEATATMGGADADVDMNAGASEERNVNHTTDKSAGANPFQGTHPVAVPKSLSPLRQAMAQRRRHPHKHNHKHSPKKEGKNKHKHKPPHVGGRVGGRRQRRLWQLPESSIIEYTKWIQDKPEADRTPSEERFLWKCMIRSLGVVPFGKEKANNGRNGGRKHRQERIREFVDRLETKEPAERTANEELFVKMYHKRRSQRKAARKAQRKQQQQQASAEPVALSWMRNGSSNSACASETSKNRPNGSDNGRKKGLEPMASLESLRESMMKMGLSSDKLKQVRFAD